MTEVTDEMVTRFLQWRIPDDFHPDGGINFNRAYAEEYGEMCWPTGTNLLHAGQAKAMLEFVINGKS